MTDTFDLTITTPEKTVYDGQAVSLIVPAALGRMGILAHHAPIVALLRPGVIMMRDCAGAETAYESTGEGYMECSGNRATLLLERCVPGREPAPHTNDPRHAL